MRLQSDFFKSPIAPSVRLTILISAGAFLVLCYPLATSQFIYFDDLKDQNIPFRYFYWKCLQAGDSFLWCPNVFNGYYLHGEGQVGMLHPVHLVLYGFLPFTLAFNLDLYLSYVAIYIGMFVLLRAHGLPRFAALGGAFSFSFCGYNLLHLIHLNAIAVTAHVPWLLYAMNRLYRNRRRTGFIWSAIALLTASQILNGHPQSVLISAVVEMGYVVFLARLRLTPSICLPRNAALECAGLTALSDFAERRSAAADNPKRRQAAALQRSALPLRETRGCCRTWILLLLAKVTGILLGGVQLVPTFDMLASSVRSTLISTGDASAFALSGSLHPLNFVQLFAPYLLANRQYGWNTHEFGIYNGGLSLLAFLWCVTRRNQLGRFRPLATWAMIAAVLMTILSLGAYGWLYPIVLKIPLLNVFRIPARFMMATQFCMAIVTAIFLFDISRRMSHKERLSAHVTIFPRNSVVSDARENVGARTCSRSDRHQESAAGAASYIGPIAAISKLLVLSRSARQDGWLLLWSLPVVSLIVLYCAYHTSLFAAWDIPIDRSNGSIAQWYPPILYAALILLIMRAVRGSQWSFLLLIALGCSEQAVYGLSYNYRHPLIRYRDIIGIPEVQSKTQKTLYSWRNELLARDAKLMFGYAGLFPQRQLSHENIARVNRLPRARLYTSTIGTSSVDATMALLAIEATAITDAGIIRSEGAFGHVTIHSDRPGIVRLTTSAESEQFFFLLESYHEGWQVEIDGIAGTVYRAFADYVGCVVPGGVHEVEFRFAPRSMRYGVYMSLMGMMLMFTVVGNHWRRSRGH